MQYLGMTLGKLFSWKNTSGNEKVVEK